ncbi:hypothetical protein BD413DRAFT_301531 [Trametes elegans]|nr:hypothetical protein BD413DRAFT_301531 [Trametes elegans]
MATVVVDDSRPLVQYEPGWIWDRGVVETNVSRHGAAVAGLTAWLTFAGTGVQVVGTLGPSARFGQLKTAYSIDDEAVGSYDAPVSASAQLNVTFFAKRDPLGEHVVKINNTDESTPHNTFRLNYFLIDTAPTTTTSLLDTSSPFQPSSTLTYSVLPPPTLATVVPTLSTVNSPSVLRLGTGAMAGIVVGGVGPVLIIGVLSCCLIRQRRRCQADHDDPFWPFVTP